ncbi:endonuclease/exonuclease/phosphatase family protein [Dyadobacter crusticola]|uniref:endonuclease/exonuclease/phosphatase family protein n=1 Tax=Dyadobacter crusticola TaxID=292407 RepID=UPI0004E21418|nr:endonuclease/exonuclease/phosphatase family protein [Dyadobacter crusticola]
MKGLIKFLWFLYTCFVFYTFLVYGLVLWTPFDGWIAGFMMMSFPVVMIVHIVSVPVWFLFGSKKALLPLVTLAVGCIFLPRTFAFGNQADAGEDQKRSFKVLGYNAHVFMLNSNRRDPATKQQIASMKEWISGTNADILCMPEFYDEDVKLFRTTEYFRKQGYRYSVNFERSRKHKEAQYLGLALFSKYPIISQHDTIFQAQNGMIRADIAIGRDTVRVVALHLYSMTLNLSRLAHQKQMDGVVKEGKFTFGKMKDGFKKRSKELAALQAWTLNSPYPVLICGDFNEIPYGYVYGELRRDFANAFEEKGTGFGFTFNHIPYFIRIDHQFYDSKKLDLLNFTTHRDVKYSDHYPITGTYRFSDQ